MRDEAHEKRLQKNQMLAMLLLAGLFLVWIQFFAPPPPPPNEAIPVPGDVAETTATDVLSVPDAGTANEKSIVPGAMSTWPYLPAFPEIADPAAEEVVLENEYLHLVFTRIGGRLKQAKVLVGEGHGEDVELVPTGTTGDDISSDYPLGLTFFDPQLGTELNRRRFEVEQSDCSVTFSIELPNAARIHKTFTLCETTDGDLSPYVLNAKVSYQNLEPTVRNLGLDRTPSFELAWSPGLSGLDPIKPDVPEVKWWREGDLDYEVVTEFEPVDGEVYDRTVAGVDWLALTSTYFVVGMKPDFEDSDIRMMGGVNRYRAGLTVPAVSVEPDATHVANFRIYMGPRQNKYLAAAWEDLPETLQYITWSSVMDTFAKVLLAMLNWFYAIIPNYGIAIILLTVVVRLAMLPLTLKSMKSMKRMQMLAPEMEKLKEKYGEDPQELNRQMMTMYKERGINPLGGCLPMLMQLPVFLALYRMLWSAFELRGAPFVGWINDLSAPDNMVYLPFMKSLPFIPEAAHYLNVLPILMGVAMILNMKLMPNTAAMQNPAQKTMMTIMPVFFSVICYNMASGLNLYILTSTLLGMAQQTLTRVKEEDLDIAKKPQKKRRNFYAAAQERKRREAKEVRKNRKGGNGQAKGKSGDGKGRRSKSDSAKTEQDD
jgi:YidC/Oxa1 family membrane protein insertase